MEQRSGAVVREENRVRMGSQCCECRIRSTRGRRGAIWWGPPPTCFNFLQNIITVFHAFILYISFAIFNINQWIIEDHSIIHLESIFTFGKQASCSITPSLKCSGLPTLPVNSPLWKLGEALGRLHGQSGRVPSALGLQW